MLKIPSFDEMLKALQRRMKINLPIMHVKDGKHAGGHGASAQNPAGSKLLRKWSRDSRHKHMWS